VTILNNFPNKKKEPQSFIYAIVPGNAAGGAYAFPTPSAVAAYLHRRFKRQPTMPRKFTSLLMAGTSGLVLPVPNKQAFPEAFRSGSRLAYYSTLFNSIEINSTFYKLHLPATFSRWAEEVQPDFRFTVKLWRGITHVPGLRFMPVDVHRCLYAAHRLGEKKGCLLIQLPPGLTATATEKLEQLLDKVCAADPARSWKLAVEFRHRSWYTPEVEALLHRYQASRVLHDMPPTRLPSENPSIDPSSPPHHFPSAKPPADPSAPVPFVYLRFHGPAGDYKGGYPDATLRTWAEKAVGWLSAGKEVYVYFNNTIGDALADLTRLRTLILDHPLPTSSSSATAATR
jgi:uncharacterized protein YecE (DUF72 family)